MSLLRAYSEHFLEAGCDEAGRGCLAGPVVAAAVILPRGEDFPDLNDSKQLSEKQRVCLREIIMAKAVSYGVGIVSNEEIDKINILNASFLAMHRAIDQLSVVPELLLIDGNRFNRYKDIDYRCIVKGDATYQSIAAASILAKTTRDFLMCDYAREYPGYFWEKNKGYPTVEHRRAIAKLGVTPLHRKSFNMGIQLSLF